MLVIEKVKDSKKCEIMWADCGKQNKNNGFTNVSAAYTSVHIKQLNSEHLWTVNQANELLEMCETDLFSSKFF